MRFINRSSLRFKKHYKRSHKGDNGRVLIVGGSEDYVGAVCLAGVAALRSGADIVTIAAPEKVAWHVNRLTPDLITKKLPGKFLHQKHLKTIEKLAKNKDVMLVGNGLGLRKETVTAIRKLISSARLPLVIDADGIKAIGLKDANQAILTPHRKELNILCTNSGVAVPKDLKKLQSLLKSNVLLIKGKIDVILSSTKVLYNKTGNEAMTKAGTGDILAGLCAGFVAQRHDLLEAASMAAYINGAIGNLERKKRGYSFIASDMLQDIKAILRKNAAALF